MFLITYGGDVPSIMLNCIWLWGIAITPRPTLIQCGNICLCFMYEANRLEFLVLDRNAWNHITVYTLFILAKNTWNYLIVCKQMIVINQIGIVS